MGFTANIILKKQNKKLGNVEINRLRCTQWMENTFVHSIRLLMLVYFYVALLNMCVQYQSVQEEYMENHTDIFGNIKKNYKY